MPNIDKQRLAHVYWLGGSPCAGKSTVAEMLAERYDLHLYHCDHEVDRHKARATEAGHPTFHRLMNLSGDALWMRSLEEQFAGVIQFSEEVFGLILEDLLVLPAHKPILAEGAALLPQQTIPLLTYPRQAMWLIPTEAFQREHYAQRLWIHHILADCSAPDQAFENWMQRDARFALWLSQQVEKLDGRSVTIMGDLTLNETADLVATHFGLGSCC